MSLSRSHEERDLSGASVDKKTSDKNRKARKRKVSGKTKSKTSGKSPLKKLKNWGQIAQLDFPLEDWPAYQQSLALRSVLIDWRTIWPGKTFPLAWATTFEDVPSLLATSERLSAWIRVLQNWRPEAPLKARKQQELAQDLKDWSQSVESRLTGWEEGESAEPQESFVVAAEMIAAAWLLPAISSETEGSSFAGILEWLISWSRKSWEPVTTPLLASLLGVELPLTLHFQFSDLPQVREACDNVPDQLRRVVDACLDGNGIPNATVINDIPLLLASWTRSAQLGRSMSTEVLIDATDDQYQWAVRQLLRLLRSDGTMMLTRQAKSPKDAEWIQALLNVNDDLEDWQAASLAYPTSTRFAPKGMGNVKESRLPDAADESEWGKVAILRSKWKPKADKLAVAFDQRDLILELENSRTWLDGKMETRLRVNGKEAELDETWTELCWHSDDDCVYLELQNELGNGLGVIQRQFLLARYHRFCLIADSVLLNDADQSERDHSIDHYWSLPLADQVSFEAAQETHEGRLIQGKHQLSVLPLTLPEWRVEFSRGSLSTEMHQLRTHYSLPAGRLYQAVMLDLDHRRSREPLTWRHLLVGENLEQVTIDQAVGFRVQLDRMQYLIYRSLAPIVGRTLLGHNYYCDFYSGQFQPNGLCEDILMINGPEDSDS